MLKTLQADLGTRMKKHQRETSKSLEQQKMQITASTEEMLTDIGTVTAKLETVTAKVKELDLSFRTLSQAPVSQPSSAQIQTRPRSHSHSQGSQAQSQAQMQAHSTSFISTPHPSSASPSPDGPPAGSVRHSSSPGQPTSPAGYLISPPPAYMRDVMAHLHKLQIDVMHAYDLSRARVLLPRDFQPFARLWLLLPLLRLTPAM